MLLRRIASTAIAAASRGLQSRHLSQSQKLPIEVLRKLPKAELHRHLDGAMRVSTVLDLAKEQGVKLPATSEEELKKHLIVPMDCASLTEYLAAFDVTLSVLQKAYAITRATYECAADAAADGVNYLEIRFSPILHTREGMGLSEVMEAVSEGLVMAEQDLPITVRIIVCGMRHMHGDVTEKLAQLAWRYRNKGVVAFDLAGPEDGFSSRHHAKAFDLVRRKFVNCTLHSGEAAGWESIQDSIRFCGAQRIGHGVRLEESPTLKKFVIDRGIALEMCVTSNIQTKAVQRIQDHPIRRYFDEGVIVVPCTDNTLMSDVTLSSELKLLQDNFDFTVPEIVKLLDNGFCQAFLSNTHRRRLRAQALNTSVSVLKEHGYDVSPIVNDFAHYASAGVHLLATGPYWGRHKNPELTVDILRKVPKTDLHCRLDGSVSFNTLFSMLDDAKIDLKQKFGITASSPKELERILTEEIRASKGTALSEVGKAVFNSVLQSPAQVHRALDDILAAAAFDGVTYMELVVRPQAHLQNVFKDEQDVVDCVLAAKTSLEKKYNIQVGVVTCVSSVDDDAITFHKVAQLAVQNRDRGVCGFGVFGMNDITHEDFSRYYRTTFNYLKQHNINVTISAGHHDASSVGAALHEGGAWRISGAFKAHRLPLLVSYLANCATPVELATTDRLQSITEDVTLFAGSVVRLLLDNDVKITFCSFRHAMNPLGRTGELLDASKRYNLTIAELLRVISHGHLYNFQSAADRERMTADFWRKSIDLLQPLGFQYFHKKSFFPRLETETPHKTVH